MEMDHSLHSLVINDDGDDESHSPPLSDPFGKRILQFVKTSDRHEY